MFLFQLVLTMLTCLMRSFLLGELGMCSALLVGRRVRSKISLLSTDHAD